jgi:hypothetical protein
LWTLSDKDVNTSTSICAPRVYTRGELYMEGFSNFFEGFFENARSVRAICTVVSYPRRTSAQLGLFSIYIATNYIWLTLLATIHVSTSTRSGGFETFQYVHISNARQLRGQSFRELRGRMKKFPEDH